MSQSFKKTALKALLPALLLGQPGFASVRSSSVSRGRSGRAVLAVSQASTPDTKATTGERWTAPAQSNPFAAFGGAGARQERPEVEPGAETLAFLEAQGLLSPQGVVQASQSGEDFEGRKLFAAFPAGNEQVQCDKPGRPWNFIQFSWWAPNSCSMFFASIHGSTSAQCRDLYNQCKVTNAVPVDISLTNSLVGQSAGTNAVVGSLGTTDADAGDTHQYTLVSGAGSTNNDLFNIAGGQLRANDASTMAAGVYSVRIRTTDGGGASYEASFTITVVDDIAPTVLGIGLEGSPAPTATQVVFVITFSEPVIGVSAAAFGLTSTGHASGDIVGVEGSDGRVWRITVGNLQGFGTLRLDFQGGTSVVDAGMNGPPGGFSAGPSHTVGVPTVPAAPASVTVTAGHGELFIQPTPPANDGGSPILGYDALVYPGGAEWGCHGAPDCLITFSGLTPGEAYTVIVSAFNEVGSGAFSPPSDPVVVLAYDQEITFGSIDAQPITGLTLDLAPKVSTKSGLQVSFSSGTTGVCTVTPQGLVTFVQPGTCTINAVQEGNSTWLPAQESTSFEIAALVPDAPSITSLVRDGDKVILAFDPPAFSGGVPITGYIVYSTGDFTPVHASASPVELEGLAPGEHRFQVAAVNSVGEGDASDPSDPIVIARSQWIDFDLPGPGYFGGSQSLSATAESALPVTFTSKTPSKCTVSGNVATLVGIGTCTILARQEGDAGWLPAEAEQSFEVAAMIPGAPSITSVVQEGGKVIVSFTPPDSDGGDEITGYTVFSTNHGAGFYGTSSPIELEGLAPGPHQFSMVAANSAGDGFSSQPFDFTVAAPQTIAFAPVALWPFGSRMQLSAVVSSGLALTYASSTPEVCTVDGSEVDFAAAGTCTIVASQAGNAEWLPVEDEFSFTVTANIPDPPVITGVTVAGTNAVEVAFQPPASSGGVAITEYRVYSTFDGQTRTGSTSPILFEGLAAGAVHQFTVLAHNAAGLEALSQISDEVVLAAADPVSGLVTSYGQALDITALVRPFATHTLAIVSQPLHGTATIEGDKLRYTPAAGYAGVDGFTYNTRVGDSTSEPATVDIEVLGPLLLIDGPAFLPIATAGEAYAQAFTASGGMAPYAFTAAGLPAGLAMGTDGQLSGTPTEVGPFTVSVSVTDSTTGGGTFSASQDFNLVVQAPALAVGDVSADLGYNAPATPITLDISGQADAVVLMSPAANGIATASGTTVSYQPNEGFAGTDSFTYAASDAYGTTSAPATVTVRVAHPVLQIAPATLADAVAGTDYSQRLAGSGGHAPYSYELHSGSLPAGLELVGDELRGIPTATGSFGFSVLVRDSSSGDGPFAAPQAFTLQVDAPALVARDVSAGVAYNAAATTIALDITGTPASLALGAAPSHGQVDIDGTTLTYQPNAGYVGTDSFSYVVSDAYSTAAPATVTITVAPPTVVVPTLALADATAGTPYLRDIEASGGVTPYTYTVSAGALPPGMVLSPSGTLSGAPLALGDFAFTVTATDANSNYGPFHGSQSYTLKVGAPELVAGNSSASVGYNAAPTPVTLAITGTATSVVVASQPSHGSAVASGTVINYTPDAGYAGPDSFTYEAVGPYGTSAPATVQITVGAPTVAITTASLPDPTAGSPYSQVLSAGGGHAPYTWSVSSGTLPDGLQLSSDGSLAGTPAKVGAYAFTISASDSSSGLGPFAASQSYSLEVVAPALAADDVSATVAHNSAAVQIALDVTGPAERVEVLDWPAHGSTVVIGGGIGYYPEPGYAGPDSFTYRAVGAYGTSNEATVSITVTAPTLALSALALDEAVAGESYSQALEASGGQWPYRYEVSAGALPPGMSLSTEGALSGRPGATGVFAFTVTATDSSHGTGPFTAVQAYTLEVVAPALAVADASANVAYNAAATDIALDITGAAVSVAIVSQPAHGIATVNGTTVSYQPHAGYAGPDSFTYEAIGPYGSSAPATVSITVGAPTVQITPATVAHATAGMAYAQAIGANGGTGPYTYLVTGGALPSGVSLSADGQLSGIPTEAGTFAFTVTASDSSSGAGPFTASQSYTLEVAVPALSAGDVTWSVGYNAPAAPVTLAISGDAVSVDVVSQPGHGTAVATGTTVTYQPHAGYAGPDSFSYEAIGAYGNRASAQVDITVGSPAVQITTATLAAATAGTAYSQAIGATGGTGPYTYLVSNGALPPGVSLSTDGGLSGIPTATGTFAFTVTASDSSTGTGPFQATQQFTMDVAAPALSAGNVSWSVVYNAAAATVPLDVSGEAASVAVVSAPAHGTAVASGTTITYQPSAGYAGADSFTYQAVGPYGSSAPATVSITVGVPAVAITTTTLADAMAGSAYSQSLGVSGGTSPYTWAVTAGALPAGITLSAAGELSGIPAATGSFALTVTATDASVGEGPFTASQAYTLEVTAPGLSAGDVSRNIGYNAAATAIVLDITGSATSVEVVDAPAHGTAVASGTTITYQPVAGYAGADSFTYQAVGPYGSSAPATVSITVGAPAVAITTTTLADAVAGTSYSQVIGATGGTGPYTWAVTAGALPAGLSLSLAGELLGTLTEAGSFAFTVGATDSSTGSGPFTASQAYTLEVAAPALSAGDVTTNVGYNATATAIVLDIQGEATSVAIVSAPAHGTATASGTTITYQPVAGYVGADSFTYRAVGPYGSSAVATVEINVAAPVVELATTSLADAVAGSAYAQTLAVAGGTAPYTWAVTAGALPAGVVLSDAGQLAGTPAATGTFTFTVGATDSSTGTGPFTASRQYTLQVEAPALAAGDVGSTVAYNANEAVIALDISGNASSVAIVSMPLHGTASVDGLGITYTPQPGYAGPDSFTYTASDPYSTTAPATVSVTVAAPALAIATTTLAEAVAGSSYGEVLVAQGGAAPYAWAVTAGSLPAGLALSASGELSGVPQAVGSFSFTVGATDSSTGTGPFTASRSYTVDVAAPALAVADASATVGYGSAATPLGLAITGAATSVAIASAPAHGTATVNGVGIDYTPEPGYAGVDSFTYTASDAYSTTAPATVTITVIAPEVAIATPSLADATAGDAYSQAITASGGMQPYAYAITSGVLPPGMSLSADGVLSGTPLATGSFAFTVAATDSSTGAGPFTASQAFTLQVEAPALAVGAVTATVGYAAPATVVALDIAGAATSVAVASLPAHGTVMVDGTTLRYQPNPGYAGTDSFSYTASDAYSTTAPATVGIIVTAPSVAITTPVLVEAVADTSYSQVLAVDGGAAPYTWALASGALPAGLSLSADGEVSGTPTATGSFAFTIAVTDSSTGTGPFTATQAYTLQVGAPALAAGDVSRTVGYGAAATTIELDISGNASSVAVVTAPAHGTAIASGTTIRYQPNPGYAGLDSFTYAASDAYSTTAVATVEIEVEAPVVALAGEFDTATAGVAYAQSLRAGGGMAPYAFAVTAGALPAGLQLSAQGELSGTPTEAGEFRFTVTVTDSSTGLGPFTAVESYRLLVDAPSITIGPDELPAAAGASEYRQQLSAEGGVAPYAFELASGALPTGLVLSVDGAISGLAEVAGEYAFVVQATDANGFSARAGYTIRIETVAQAIEAVVATPAEPVYSPGATFVVSARGGASSNPVVFASTTPGVCQVDGTTVSVLAAGLCSLSADQAGDAVYLAASRVWLHVPIAAALPGLSWLDSLQRVYGEDDFELPEPDSASDGAFSYSSTNPEVATVSGRTVHLVGPGSTTLVATQEASGSYLGATVEVELVVSARPDPTADAQVRGGLQAQADATVRFAQAQQANIRDRLRQVRNGNNPSSSNLVLAWAGQGRAPGVSLPVGTSSTTTAPALPQGWGVWLAGTATFGKAGRGAGAFDFDTGGITLGADRALGERMLFGMAASWGRQGTDFEGTTSKVDAEQRSLAVYGLWRVGEHLFLDGMLASGQLDFDLARWSDPADALARGRRDGSQRFGSLTFGYEHRAKGGMNLTGYGRYDGHSATLDGYAEQGVGGLYALQYGRQRIGNSALALGVEGSHPFERLRSSWRPFWSLEYRQALENRSDVAVSYVQRPLGSDHYSMSMRSYNDDSVSVGAGMELKLDSGWSYSLQLGREQGRNALRSNSVGLQVRFGNQAPVAPVYVDDDYLGQAGGYGCHVFERQTGGICTGQASRQQGRGAP